VGFYHLAVIHLVNVVAGKNENATGALFLQNVNVMKDCVGCPEIPRFSRPELRGDRKQKLIESVGKNVPTPPKMIVQGLALVLGENVYPLEPGVDAIRQSEVDYAIVPGKWNCGFCPISGQRIEPLPLSASQD
jgi:hypothetical protein